MMKRSAEPETARTHTARSRARFRRDESGVRQVPSAGSLGAARSAGNLAVRRLLASGQLQAKLELDRPGDRWEREADRVADRVVAGGGPPAVQRKCAACEEKEAIQAKERPGRQPRAGAAGKGVRALGGAGEPLPWSTRSFFEGRFGRDFGGVRIHRDAGAAGAAAALGARAFTVGRHIAFGAGEYAPGAGPGRHLLAHELAHVVQQARADRAAPGGSPPALQRFTAAECTASGCTPASRCQTVQADFERAERYVSRAIDALGATPLESSTQRAIRWYFHRDADTPGGDIRRRLGLIETVLLLTDVTANFRCSTSSVCDGVYAYVTVPRSAQPDTPRYRTITLCESYFDKNDQGRAETLIHEAAHLIGMSVSTDDVYDHTFRFRGLSTDQAILNSDSYALFASAIGTGSIGLSVAIAAGLGGGVVAGGPAGAGWSLSYLVDTTFQHPVLHLFNPALRLSATFVGVPESGPRATQEVSALVGVLPGFRIEDPRPSGGTPSFSLFGGPSFNFRDDEFAVGAQAGIGFGYRWSFLDLSAGVSYIHDPTALSGAQNLVQIGTSVSAIFPAFNP